MRDIVAAQRKTQRVKLVCLEEVEKEDEDVISHLATCCEEAVQVKESRRGSVEVWIRILNREFCSNKENLSCYDRA